MEYTTWWLRLPTSSSHALIGGLVGAGLAKGGLEAIKASSVQKAALFIVISPVAGLLVAAGLMWLLNLWLRRHQESGNETVFKAGQLVSSAAVSLGHGTNDAQKTMGVIAALLVATGHLQASGDSLPMADEESAPARGGEMVPAGHLRATHDDRNRAVELLRVAAGDGRLTLEELDERVGAALTARTYSELAALVSDLPAAPESPVGAPEAKPKDLVRIDCHSSSTRRDGPWMVPRRMQVQVTGGSVTLDFTQAVTWWPSLQLDVAVRAGSLRLVTKPGILVSTDDLAVHSSSVKVRAPWGPGVPVRFRIDVAGTVASSSFKARPPRRTLWQWLRRRPLPPALPPGRT